jgi:hypothetical protein
MKRWGLLLLTVVIIVSAVLAYFLRGWINDNLIVPLAYLWWRIGIYYHSVSEEMWWTIMLIVTLMLCGMSLASVDSGEWFFHDWKSDEQSTQGTLEELIEWMLKLPRSAYHKWMLANRLGKLARSFLIQREGGNVQHWDGSLDSSVWDLPDEVSAYLRAGLKRPPSASEMLPRSSPLNLEPQKVVEYLESQMEDRPNGN